MIRPVRNSIGVMVNHCEWCQRRPGARRAAHENKRLCDSCANAFDAAWGTTTAPYRERGHGTRL